MPHSKRGLGRGLSALIPTGVEEVGAGVQEIPVEDIAPNPLQPRQHVDANALQELAESIREHGLIQPLIVTRADRADGVSYYIIAGERRWAAAKLAGLRTVPVIIKEATPQEMLELALVENLQREDLNPLEEALAYQHLCDEFGLTHEQVAAKVGKHRVTITNTMRLLRLAEPVKEALLAGRISEGHARAMLPLVEDVSAQTRVLRAIQQRGLSVRQTEELVRRIVAGEKSRARNEPSPETKALEEMFRQALGTKVQLFRGRRGGRLVIHFYSDEELQGLYDLLVQR